MMNHLEWFAQFQAMQANQHYATHATVFGL